MLGYTCTLWLIVQSQAPRSYLLIYSFTPKSKANPHTLTHSERTPQTQTHTISNSNSGSSNSNLTPQKKKT
ncbi:hypothetical protein BDZ94DRAFT_1263357 [Collybia nuda]|uniref:Uncharacterized protein n=1 Tax=Collybia nuda TaxID=64659 RepID=A0A9P5Y3E6_9AGAR|nr:hypothetical protein BDZ94DRAFT_1263357 [Collybia nuda]